MAEYNWQFQQGDVVGVPGKGDFTVSDRRRIERGRNAGKLEIKLAPLSGAQLGRKNAVGLRATVTPGQRPRFLCEPSGDHSDTEVKGSAEKHRETLDASMRRKAEFQGAGRDSLGRCLYIPDFMGMVSERFMPGDRATVRYRGGAESIEIIEDINVKTGKVAIRSRNKSGKRWLPAQQVVACESEKRKLPKPLNEARMEMVKNGQVVVLTFGSEFIERSLIVGKDRWDVVTKRGYECPGRQVFQDPDTGLYWREGGSFD